MIPVDGILSKRGHSNTSQNQVKLELEQQQFLLFAMKIRGTHRSSSRSLRSLPTPSTTLFEPYQGLLTYVLRSMHPDEGIW